MVLNSSKEKHAILQYNNVTMS